MKSTKVPNTWCNLMHSSNVAEELLPLYWEKWKKIDSFLSQHVMNPNVGWRPIQAGNWSSVRTLHTHAQLHYWFPVPDIATCKYCIRAFFTCTYALRAQIILIQWYTCNWSRCDIQIPTCCPSHNTWYLSHLRYIVDVILYVRRNWPASILSTQFQAADLRYVPRALLKCQHAGYFQIW